MTTTEAVLAPHPSALTLSVLAGDAVVETKFQQESIDLEAKKRRKGESHWKRGSPRHSVYLCRRRRRRRSLRLPPRALLLIGGNYTWADCTPTRRRLKSRFTRPVLAISWPFSSSVSSLTKPPLLPDQCLCRPSSHAPVSSVPSGLPQQDGPAPARPLPPPQSTGATGRSSTAQ